MQKQTILLGLIFLSSYILTAQAQNNITVEDIWRDKKFTSETVPGFNFLKDGKHYTKLVNKTIQQFDLVSGKAVQTLLDVATLDQAIFAGELDSYTFSSDESKLLLKADAESIYRRSSKAHFFIWDRKTKALTKLSDGEKQGYATFNPAANKIAFVSENNLYYKDIVTGKITQITTDGKKNEIINGSADWVYEEEFSFAQAFHWSPDGTKIAFMRFDESEVPQFTMTNFKGDLYPEYETFKYPKVGEKNAIVSIHIYDTKTGKTTKANTGDEPEMYFPRIKWTQDPNQLCIFKMNRHQNELELLVVDAQTGATKQLMKETNQYYVDIHDNLTFLKDGNHFIWTSEQDGYNHIYLYNMKGQIEKQLTKGNYDVTKFYGINEANNKLYYRAAETSPLEEHIYVINKSGKGKKQLSTEKGTHSAQFSSTFDYYVDNYSTANLPATYSVKNHTGKTLRVIEDNKKLQEAQKFYKTSPVDFFEFTTKDDITLNGWMMKPPNFDPQEQYPIFMYLYGGPGSQQVKDSWRGTNYWWFQSLAQQGYIVACIDNRGTGARGEAFKKMTYLQLGKYETIDQIEAAKYLGNLPYADKNRIGIFGWSYGGFMSSLCLLKGSDVFKAAIAVAPVTSWRWYDTIYTERFMRTEKENPDGYKDNSPVYFADQLEGHYLLVHGGSDDNVHWQHSAEMMNALVKANKQFDTYYYPNRAHGIRDDEARTHLYNKMTHFLNEKLKGDAVNYNLPKKP